MIFIPMFQIDALIKEEVQKVRTELMIKFKNENEELLSKNRYSDISVWTVSVWNMSVCKNLFRVSLFITFISVHSFLLILTFAHLQ